MHISLGKKSGLYNTYHELLSEKWIVKRFRFHASYIISPQSVAIFATSHLVGFIEYQYNSPEDKVDKSAVATSYQVGWIDYTLQDILGQKFWQCKLKTQKPCNENPSLKSADLLQIQKLIENWSIPTVLVPYSLRFSKVHWCYNNNIISKLYCTYRNHVTIPKKKTKQKKQKQKATTTKQAKTATAFNSLCLHHRWRCYQAI